jgi:hypothetical protein
LEPGVEVDVFLLVVVLDECRKKQSIGECHVNPWANQPKCGFVPGTLHGDLVIACTQGCTDKRLKTVPHFSTYKTP